MSADLVLGKSTRGIGDAIPFSQMNSVFASHTPLAGDHQ
jgi:hypothetical protein